MAKTDAEIAALWVKLGDMMMECSDERSRVEWLAAAFELPEPEILAALRYGESLGEVRTFPNGYWRML